MLRFVVTIVAAILGLATFSSGLNNQNSAFKREQGIRSAKANEILKYMNLTADPCQDFYEYACGNWARHHPARRENEITTTQSQLEKRVAKDIQTLLEGPVSLPDDELDESYAKDFYKACLHVDLASHQKRMHLKYFVQVYGGLPYLPDTYRQASYNWVRAIAMLRADCGLDILIGVEINTNLRGNGRNSIYLTEPKSTLIPAELCSALATEQVDMRSESYNVIQKEVAHNMQLWLGMKEGESNRFAGDIVGFEFSLCKHMRKDHLMSTNEVQDRGAYPGRTTGQSRLHGNRPGAQHSQESLTQLSQQFGGVINFKQFVDITFNSSINDAVYMRSESYFQHLAEIIKKTEKPTLANYIIYRGLSVLNIPPGDRHKACLELVLHYFTKVLGKMYKRKVDRSESRGDIHMLFGEVSQTFRENLKGVEWLGKNSRLTVEQRLAQFKVTFPIYPKLDLSDLRNESLYWLALDQIMKYNAKKELSRLYSEDLNTNLEGVEAQDVLMRFMPAKNEIVTGWGLLQPPFYDYFYPSALKFSLVGQRMARELVTAFDEQGWSANPMSPMRWDEYTTQEFRNRSECYRTQISNYLYNNPDTFRNASRLRELIADSNGLNIAFSAYLGWLDSMEPTNRVLVKETLSGLDFTNTQLFFINFAQTRCAAKYDEKPAPNFLPMDRHTAERFDVNGPLANYVEFAREFGCAIGSEMNVDDKCVLY